MTKIISAAVTLLVLIYIGVCSGCSATGASTTTAAATAVAPTPSPPVAEIIQATQEFLKRAPVQSVRGVTLHRQSDDYYVVGADYISKDGKSDVYQLIARRYSDGQHEYWKVEDLTSQLVIALDSNKDREE